MTDPLPPGAVIGVLGGGQLGRMLSVAASRLGLRCHVYEPGADAPAGHVAERLVTAGYDDTEALRAFGSAVDVITYEFENVPAEALDLLGELAPIRPGRMALATSQDRLVEKRFLRDLGLEVAPFAPVDSLDDLVRAIDRIGTPAILKTRRFGYDGKGQVRLPTTTDRPHRPDRPEETERVDEGERADEAQRPDPAERVDQAERALAEIAGAPAVLEGFVPFELEISVIAARSVTGEIACFDPGHNEHLDGILRRTTVPAPVDDAVRAAAVDAAGRVLDALDHVGVLGIELFVTADGLVVNEFAPRVHNSGHWTQNGCVVDQFEQHVRAVAGWPLGDPTRHSDVVMDNLIGHEIDRVAELVRRPGVAVHAYGKSEIRAGRKMGHVNRVADRSR